MAKAHAFYLLLIIPRYYESYDNGRTVDYPIDMPIPRIGEEINWVDAGLDKTYYLRVTEIKHRVDLSGYCEVQIITEHINN